MFLLRAVSNILVKNPTGHMCVRCLMVSLSGPVSCYFSFILLPLGTEKW